MGSAQSAPRDGADALNRRQLRSHRGGQGFESPQLHAISAGQREVDLWPVCFQDQLLVIRWRQRVAVGDQRRYALALCGSPNPEFLALDEHRRPADLGRQVAGWWWLTVQAAVSGHPARRWAEGRVLANVSCCGREQNRPACATDRSWARPHPWRCAWQPWCSWTHVPGTPL